MTDEELAAIEARAKAATSGPWTLNKGPDDFFWLTVAKTKTNPAMLWSFADAEFIAHARADIPALVAEIKRVKSDAEALADALDGIFADREGKYTTARAALDAFRAPQVAPEAQR